MQPFSHSTSLEARAVAGDHDALAQLLVEHSPALLRRLSARLALNPFADFSVDDVMQEVFLDVFRGIHAFRHQEKPPFSSWLIKVADNRLASLLRQRSAVKRGGGRLPLRTSASS